MDAYSLHLAMAALVGASVVALSAYYTHRKTLSQFLEFSKSVEKEREREREDNLEAESPQHLKKRRSGHGRRKGNGYFGRAPASFPDVTVVSDGADGEDKSHGPVPLDGIPAGLPRLHTLPEGKVSSKRATSPRSPVASASAFEGVEGSDEDDVLSDSTKLDATYLHPNWLFWVLMFINRLRLLLLPIEA